jgi:hypothetical protein
MRQKPELGSKSSFPLSRGVLFLNFPADRPDTLTRLNYSAPTWRFSIRFCPFRACVKDQAQRAR